ncbi:MAG: symmetrical bis(5'-nucleosyl)-tetraphosphatase [Gammaproteobacteria bacterium]|nr:symmetrical bis(5'-nucleosyl)-tetraphosphatase [Gammaproteobacteria bacterium]
MATYAVGDIQGCLEPLKALLNAVSFSSTDTLWVAGDLVNRGPDSLATLRYIKSMGSQAVVILGNHDLHLLALHANNTSLKSTDTLKPIFDAPDRTSLLAWLQQQPLLHYDSALDTVMTHAGIPPCWNLAQAQQYGQELHQVLTSDVAPCFFANMYGDQPNLWHEQLQGMERWRCITNYFTRMRFIKPNGELNLTHSGKATLHTGADNGGLVPWFKVPSLVTSRQVFGHWAALEGETGHNHIINLDMGCVWGGHLKLMCLDNGQCYTVDCP